jgi:hypothetical protein
MRAWSITGRRGVLALLSLFAVGGLLRAEDAAPPATIDLGTLPAVAYPIWLMGVAPAEPGTLGEADFEVVAPAPGRSDLLLTVIFDEGNGGFLRVYRQDGATAEMVADNLYEGSGLPNQRTLLLRGIGAQGPTRLVFQSSGATLSVRRLVWEWPQPQSLAVTGAAETLAALRGQTPLTDGDVSGQPLLPAVPHVAIAYTSTPLLTQVAKVEDGIVLAATLDRMPFHARLAGKVSGLPPGQALECWINGTKAGLFTLALPSLLDPAYFLNGASPILAGWQNGTLYVPATAWQPGENTIEFHVPEGTHAAYAMKDLVLELVYAPAAPTPTPDSTPTP